MKKKIAYIVSIIVIIIMILAFIFFYRKVNTEEQVEKHNDKIDLIYETLMKNEDIKNIETEDNIVIISICDKKNQAVVKSQREASIDKAYKLLGQQVIQYIEEKNYDLQWLKVDIIKNTKEISQKELYSMINDIQHDYSFRYGIIFEYENREIVLTEAELNSNEIIDYMQKQIDLDKLNEYLKSCMASTVDKLPDKFKIFETISYFCNENNDIYELHNEKDNTGRRKEYDLDKSEINYIIENASEYLLNLINQDGKFTYGYDPLINKEYTSYNILRHAGSIWSSIIMYDKNNDYNEEKKEKIDQALNYLNSQVKEKNKNTYYIIEAKNGEIKLGGNALAAIAMCEYTDKFEDDKYKQTIDKLGNGILSMQKENGGYIHVLNADDCSLKEEYRTVYYDGEATFALCKIYGITKDQKYLEAAKKSINYFIKNKYEDYCDHWISYAINELTKYVDNEEYYEFGLKNVARNKNKILKKSYTSHTDFEMVMQCYELYNRILEKGINVNYTKDFSIEELKEIINTRAHYQLNSFLYPEMAMYLKKPYKYYNTFFIRQSNFRIRIDDIQHSVLGYYFYNKYLDKM